MDMGEKAAAEETRPRTMAERDSMLRFCTNGGRGWREKFCAVGGFV
jgi:hypothetical protein